MVKKRLVRMVLIDLLIYGTVMVAYFYFVLRYLQGWLGHLYANDQTLYAFVSLALIVAQGGVLEVLTSFLLNHLRIGGQETT